MFSFLSSPLVLSAVGISALAAIVILVAVFLRRVVPTNEVHIVQSSKSTISYGKGFEVGNTYYQWPAWIPRFGCVVVKFPVSVFGQDLADYEAYDRGRLPFMIDVKAFFRITDSNMAAQRVSNFAELLAQLKDILRGSVRSILANHEIEEIMAGRSQFGESFTKEVNEQLKEWGVSTVKSIELMDIRDAKDSQVIKNIMEKKKSLIDMESRVEVAKNQKEASLAEISAKQETQVRMQESVQAVGIRTAAAEQEIGIAQQKSAQAVKEQAKVTAEKEMAVLQVQQVRAAEIAKDVQIVEANQSKETARLIAEGALAAKKLEAEGITAEGVAKASAEKAMQLAPIEAQIVLAKEIGENNAYQQYLISIKQVEAGQVVGIEQAKALTAANIKVIANSGDIAGGVSNVMDLFSSKGGTHIGSMLEAVGQTDQGKALLDRFLTPPATVTTSP